MHQLICKINFMQYFVSHIRPDLTSSTSRKLAVLRIELSRVKVKETA